MNKGNKVRLTDKGRDFFRLGTPIEQINADWEILNKYDEGHGMRYDIQSGDQIRRNVSDDYIKPKG